MSIINIFSHLFKGTFMQIEKDLMNDYFATVEANIYLLLYNLHDCTFKCKGIKVTPFFVKALCRKFCFVINFKSYVIH